MRMIIRMMETKFLNYTNIKEKNKIPNKNYPLQIDTHGVNFHKW